MKIINVVLGQKFCKNLQNLLIIQALTKFLYDSGFFLEKNIAWEVVILVSCYFIILNTLPFNFLLLILSVIGIYIQLALFLCKQTKV